MGPDDRDAVLEQFQALNLHEAPMTGDRRIDVEGAEESLRACLLRVAETDGAMLVAEQGGAVVGHLALTFEQEAAFVVPALRAYAYVADLFVREAVRGHGIGRSLLAEAEAIARARGVPRMMIGVLAGNPNAERLYRGFGFASHSLRLDKRLD